MTTGNTEPTDEFGPDPLRAALDGMEGIVVVCDADGTLQYWSDRFRGVTGATEERIAGSELSAFVPEADVDRLATAVAAATEHGVATVAVSLAGADGDAVPSEFRLTRWTVPDGSGAGVVGVGRERGAARSHGHDPVLDRMADAFFAVDADWQFTYANERARSILSPAMGRSETVDDLRGLNIWEEIPQAVDTAFYEAYTEAMAEQEPRSVERYYEPLDSWFEAHAYPSETGLSVYFRDVTERRRREIALEERERVLRDIYEVTADRDRSFTEKVESLLSIGCRALDVDYGTLSSVSGDDYVFEIGEAPDDEIEQGGRVPLSATNCERVVMEEQTVVLGDVGRDAPELADKAGNAEWGIVCYLGAPVLVDDDVYGTFCFYDKEPRTDSFTEWERTLVDLMSQWVGQELTRRRTRARLRRQNEQLEQFASIVSHDLRNPLNVVVAGLDLAESSGDLSELARCHRAVERMETLIDDLLTLARAGDRITEREALDLPTAAREAWAAVETPDAALVVEAGGRIRADPSRLRQLFENLFRNAVEHGPEAGTVTVGDLPDGFYVEDDGPGIPEDERGRVFETGYSTADGGTGLGLAIVAEIAEGHGWSVEARAGEVGARFELGGVERSPVE